MNTSYKSAGVDLEAYADSMARLPALMNRTFSPRVMRNDGGFAGMFQLDFDSPLFARNYKQPVLVGCKDGVGTKLAVAKETGAHDTVGIDLVAMCVNDAICCGAEPLFFLDYLAMSVDDPPLVEKLVQGISNGCLQADCALLGGETAIMPGLYQGGDYDMSGTCVGVVEKRGVIDGKSIAAGDVVIGVASSGLHSNGFSLVRKIVFDVAGLKVDDRYEPTGGSIGEELMRPTRIYVKPFRAVQSHYKVKNVLHGVAHITGGGLLENISRILPPGVHVKIERGSWDTPEVFNWLQKLGNVEDEEMARVFNMGVGLTLIVSEYYADAILNRLSAAGETATVIGNIVDGERGASWA